MSDQSDTAGPIGKIISGDSGLGVVTPEMVDERALELARMDGRSEAHEGDRENARQELIGSGAASDSQVADADVENVVTWDEAPAETGVRAPQVVPEDDMNIAETLVQEGLDEAEHDQRVSASEANPPEAEES